MLNNTKVQEQLKIVKAYLRNSINQYVFDNNSVVDRQKLIDDTKDNLMKLVNYYGYEIEFTGVHGWTIEYTIKLPITECIIIDEEE